MAFQEFLSEDVAALGPIKDTQSSNPKRQGMAIATVLSRAQRGIDAPQVRVEVDIGPGLPTFSIVGLPEIGRAHV